MIREDVRRQPVDPAELHPGTVPVAVADSCRRSRPTMLRRPVVRLGDRRAPWLARRRRPVDLAGSIDAPRPRPHAVRPARRRPSTPRATTVDRASSWRSRSTDDVVTSAATAGRHRFRTTWPTQVDGTAMRLVHARTACSSAFARGTWPRASPDGAPRRAAAPSIGAPARARVAIVVERVDAQARRARCGRDLRIGPGRRAPDGADDLAACSPTSARTGRPVGVLLDHLVAGRGARIAARVAHPTSLVTGTPDVDVWQRCDPRPSASPPGRRPEASTGAGSAPCSSRSPLRPHTLTLTSCGSGQSLVDAVERLSLATARRERACTAMPEPPALLHRELHRRARRRASSS